jgi:hypothetical protein
MSATGAKRTSLDRAGISGGFSIRRAAFDPKRPFFIAPEDAKTEEIVIEGWNSGHDKIVTAT